MGSWSHLWSDDHGIHTWKIMRHALRLSVPVIGWLIPLNGKRAYTIGDHTSGLRKCTLVQALRLCTGRTAHRGSRVIALLFLDHDISRGWGVSVTLQSLFSPGKDTVPIKQEGGWAPGPVWTGAENLASTGIRSPDRPALSQSLYRLRNPAHFGLRDLLDR